MKQRMNELLYQCYHVGFVDGVLFPLFILCCLTLVSCVLCVVRCCCVFPKIWFILKSVYTTMYLGLKDKTCEMYFVHFITFMSDSVIYIYSNCVGHVLVGDMYIDYFGFMLYVGNILFCSRRSLSDVILLLKRSEGDG